MFFSPQLTAFNVQGRRHIHHFHPGSEQIATPSQLYSALLKGWNVSRQVEQTIVYFRGGRRTSIFTFELQQEDQHMTMPVQENPALLRFLSVEPFIVHMQPQVVKQTQEWLVMEA